MKKCHLVSSGTEATETALKLVRTYGQSINKKDWHNMHKGKLAWQNGWFTNAICKNGQSKWIGYFDRNIFHVDFPYGSSRISEI